MSRIPLYLSMLFTLFCNYAQAPKHGSDSSTIRRISSIFTRTEANLPLFRNNNSCAYHTTRLVIDGIKKGILQPYFISPDDRHLKKMTKDDWLGSMAKYYPDVKKWSASTNYQDKDPNYSDYTPPDVCVYKQKYYVCNKPNKGKRPDLFLKEYWSSIKIEEFCAMDLEHIELDITEEHHPDHSISEHVHSITFGVDASRSIKGVNTRQFSLLWKDFITFLKTYHSETLYYNLTRSSWLKKDVCVTNDIYWVDYNNLPFHFLLESAKLKDLSTGKLYTVAELRKLYTDFPDENIKLDNKSLKIKITPRGSKSTVYEMPVKDFEQAIKDSLSLFKTTICTLAEAWEKRLFTCENASDYGMDEDSFLKDGMISKNGKFISNQKADTLCKPGLKPSFIKAKPIAPQKLSTEVLEEIDLRVKANAALTSGLVPLQSLVTEYVLNGKLRSICLYDTVQQKQLLPKTAFKEKNFESIAQVKERLKKRILDFNKDYDYVKGEVVAFEGLNYMATKDTKGVVPNHDGVLLLKVWEPTNSLSCEPEQLLLINIHSTQTWDHQEHSLANYQLNFLEFILPQGCCNAPVQYPIITVAWKDVKPLFLADSRAVTFLNETKTNYVDILESRNVESWFLKTGVIEKYKPF